jgi:ADP-ribosyl-[dinitrogen reductase] hydrolase
MVSQLLKDANPQDGYLYAIKQFKGHYTKCPYAYELSHFEHILSGAISTLPERRIKSSGYVIHTLEASLWCLITTNSFPDAVLKAVNLGEDTDTTGIVTGGLAGIYYGFEAIPHEWLDAIVKKEDITRLFEKYLSSRSERTAIDKTDSELCPVCGEELVSARSGIWCVNPECDVLDDFKNYR